VGESDRLHPVRHSRQLADVLPAAHLQVVPRTGHMLPAERPALVTASIARLLTEAAASRVAA
jgi:pimeloyl-ACP methyl ester carboxylesterase